MKVILSLIIVMIALVASNGAVADGDGHCKYTRENEHTPQPYKVCQMPSDAALCTELGTTNDNADAVYGDGACPTEGAIGSCNQETSKLVYYDGDPEGVEIGCGFTGGEWATPE